MFSKDRVSTFSDLLKSINNKILDSVRQGLSLSEFKSLSIGVDEPSTQYPYLAVLPVREDILRRYTTPFADVKRVVSFRIRTLKPKYDASFGQANGLGNNLKNVFSRKSNRDLWRLNNLKGDYIVFNTKIGDIRHVDYQDSPTGVIAEAQLDIEFYCQIRTDAVQAVSATELGTTSLKEMTKILYEILTRYKDGYLFDVKTLKYGSIEPISKFPAISVRPETGDIVTRFSGSDSYNSKYVIDVFTDFNNAPNSIYENLDIIHKVRDIYLANKFLFNRSYDYDVNELVMGTTFLNNIGHFTSELTLNCSSLEPNFSDFQITYESNFITNDNEVLNTVNDEIFEVQ